MEKKRNTIQRRIIFDAMKALDIHANAEQVFEYVQKKYPTISKATVYRNLSQMAESGELLNIGNLYGSTHYDHNTHTHYHFVCKACKRIFDVDGDLADIISRLKKSDDFEITDFEISFSGLCKECN